MYKELVMAIVNMNEEKALKVAKDLIDSGVSAVKILEASRYAMNLVGKKFEQGEYFIPELIFSGKIMAGIANITKLYLSKAAVYSNLGKIIIGTVEGDIHSIPKDIVVFMLDINGFEIIDLGVDVAPKQFVEAVKSTGASIVGLSGFLTLAFSSMKATVNALKEAELDVKVMIGGGQVDEQICKYTGATEYGKNAIDAVAIAKNWIRGKDGKI